MKVLAICMLALLLGGCVSGGAGVGVGPGGVSYGIGIGGGVGLYRGEQ